MCQVMQYDSIRKNTCARTRVSVRCRMGVLESQLELAGPGTDDCPGRSAGLVSVDRLWRVDDVGCLP